MPIRPENVDLYPDDWKEIRAEILERAGNQCEICSVPNYADVPRDKKSVRVVLTIAHLDHDPTNNGVLGDRPNLKALCQRCHNRWDVDHRKETRARTKATAERLAGQRDMFHD